MRGIDETSSRPKGWTPYILIPLILSNGVSATFDAPVAIEAIARRWEVGATWSGGIVTLELIFSFFTAVFLTRLLQRINVSRLAMLSTLVVAATQAMSCLPVGLIGFLILRSVVGLASGTLYAIACYTASQHVHGVRILSVSFVFASLVFGFGLIFWPVAVTAMGPISLYGPLAVFAIVLAIALAWLGAGDHSWEEQEEIEIRPAPRYAIWLLLTMCALGNGGFQMIWTFSEAVARARGIGVDKLGFIFGVSALFNAGGSLLAGVLDRRFGVALPLFFALLGGIVCGLLIGNSTSLSVFATGIFIYGIAAFSALPFLLSAGALLDNTGRAVTLASATVYLAGAVSPVLGGYIADTLSVAAVGWTSALACGAGALIALSLRKATG